MITFAPPVARDEVGVDLWVGAFAVVDDRDDRADRRDIPGGGSYRA